MRTIKKHGISALSTAKREALRAITDRERARKPASSRRVARGTTVLFAGRDTAARKSAASAVANELGRGLLRVDLSQVVGKYIGETEKNLARLFERAERSHFVLFFDEADALFGKRTGVKDAHDRYANLEVSQLLKRLGSFDGLAIVATNAKRNLDPAFVRRCGHELSFRRPAQKA